MRLKDSLRDEGDWTALLDWVDGRLGTTPDEPAPAVNFLERFVAGEIWVKAETWGQRAQFFSALCAAEPLLRQTAPLPNPSDAPYLRAREYLVALQARTPFEGNRLRGSIVVSVNTASGVGVTIAKSDEAVEILQREQKLQIVYHPSPATPKRDFRPACANCKDKRFVKYAGGDWYPCEPSDPNEWTRPCPVCTKE
jgi:hypothetical protein